MKDIDEIIKRANHEAERLFSDFPANIEKELSTFLPADEAKNFLKRQLDNYRKAYKKQPLYDVRDTKELKSRIKMVYTEKGELPYNKEITICSGTNEEKLQTLLMYQFLKIRKIEFLKKKIDEPAKKSKPAITHLQSNLNSKQVEVLYQGLKGRFIASQTSLESFTAIFSEELKNVTPVKWISSNRLLAYLFRQLQYYHSLIENKEWQSIIEKYQLLQKKNGNFLKSGDLASALSYFKDERGLEPKGYEEIDEILKNLRKLNTV
jgi:hypothetical protein